MAVDHTDAPLILIVDDEPMNRELTRTFLQSAGYRVLEASNGSQALELARQYQPVLAILDVQMAGMDGYELAARLKSDAATGHIRVALMSAQNRPVDQSRVREIGIDAYLYKLMEWRTILSHVAELVNAS